MAAATSPDIVEKIYRLRDAGQTLSKISSETGVSIRTVQIWLGKRTTQPGDPAARSQPATTTVTLPRSQTGLPGPNLPTPRSKVILPHSLTT